MLMYKGPTRQKHIYIYIYNIVTVVCPGLFHDDCHGKIVTKIVADI